MQASTYLIFSKVDLRLPRVFRCDWLDQEAGRSDVVLVVDLEPSLVLGEHDELGPQNGHARDTRLAERGVPHGEQGVPQTQDVLDNTFVRGVEEERLTALCVDVCMSAEEGRERADLVPTHEHLRLGVPEESSNVGLNAE